MFVFPLATTVHLTVRQNVMSHTCVNWGEESAHATESAKYSRGDSKAIGYEAS